MSRSPPKTDSRLLGTWQSDRRRTFRHWKPKPGARPATLRKFKSLFGELVVRWTRKRCHIELDGFRRWVDYELVASDANSVVVREWDEFVEDYRLRYIQFGDGYYWLACSSGLNEYFRRVG